MTNLADIPALLKPGLDKVGGLYPAYEAEHKKIYELRKAKLHEELQVEMKYLGAAAIRPDGAPTEMSNMEQRYITSYVPQTIALGFPITRQALEDNLYKSEFPQSIKALMHSMMISTDQLGANVLNNGFDPLFPIADGQPLFSLYHPVDGGVVPNTLPDAADMSETSIESAAISVQLFRDLAGMITQTKIEMLVGAAENYFTMDKILGSNFLPGTPNNDINPVKNLFPKGAMTYHYLTYPENWFFTTNAPMGLQKFTKTEIEMDSYTDFSTDTVNIKATSRLAFGITNKLGVFGIQGT